MLRSTKGGFIFAVSIVAIQCATTSPSCPFTDPLSRGMSCLKGSFATVQYRPLAESESLVEVPDIPPPSTLDLSEDFISYFCSDDGREVVDCAKDVCNQCKGHQRVEYFSFNPVQATTARIKCPEIMKNLGKTIRCINETVKANIFLKCSEEAYDRFSSRPPQETHVISRCRAIADAYNCYTRMEEQFCDAHIIDFSVALMRVMEDRQCTPIVDKVYVAPVSFALKNSLFPPLLILATWRLTGT